MSDETNPRILYVGNLGPDATEELLMTLFAAFGVCKSCKIIHEAGSDLYAFIEFTEHREAQMALMAMNKRLVLGRELKVNWATSPGATVKPDTSNHFHVFVGDLSPDIESAQLREAFSPFGEISDCKVIRDSQTHRSKGYAFICFVNKEDAEMAIAGMNGQWLGGRNIRTNWATGKGNTVTRTVKDVKPLDYDEMFQLTSDSNSTVYCGGVQTDLTDDLMRETFGQFGKILDIRVFKDKGFSFIKMENKEVACRAICGVHGTEVGGYVVKCSWGKESTEPNNATAQSVPPMGMMPGAAGPYMGYNPYMQGYGYYGGYWGGGYPPQAGAGGPPGPWGGPAGQQWGPQGPAGQQWGGYGDYYNYAGSGGAPMPPQNGPGPQGPNGGPVQNSGGDMMYNNQQWQQQQQWGQQPQQWGQPQQWAGNEGQ